MALQSELSLEARTERLKAIAKTLRHHVIDMVYTAQSGHIGGSLSAADFVTALYFDIMNIDPSNPKLPDRDRFILSKGHACPIWYAALAERGFFPIEELTTLRKNNSKLQGHPIATYLPGLDASSGSLGIGFAEAVGIALEGKYLNKNYKIYAVLGDGEINEGIVWEASLAASKYKLDNLIAILDKNNLQLDGTTDDVMPMEPLIDKFCSFGYQVMEMDGHDMIDILLTLEKANKNISHRPIMIIAHTIKGKGVSFMENKVEWHGKAPNEQEYRAACLELEGESK